MARPEIPKKMLKQMPPVEMFHPVAEKPVDDDEREHRTLRFTGEDIEYYLTSSEDMVTMGLKLADIDFAKHNVRVQALGKVTDDIKSVAELRDWLRKNAAN